MGRERPANLISVLLTALLGKGRAAMANLSSLHTIGIPISLGPTRWPSPWTLIRSKISLPEMNQNFDNPASN